MKIDIIATILQSKKNNKHIASGCDSCEGL